MSDLNQSENFISSYLTKQNNQKNSFLSKLKEYYRDLSEPLLIANLDEVSFLVNAKKSAGNNSGISRIPFYAPITEIVLKELLTKYSITLEANEIETIGDGLYVLSKEEKIPLTSVQSCLDILREGEFVDLLEGK